MLWFFPLVSYPVQFFIYKISFDTVELICCVSCLELVLVAIAPRYDHEDFGKRRHAVLENEFCYTP